MTTISRKEFASNVIDLRDGSKLQWIKVLEPRSLTMLVKHFAKRGWFFIYKKRLGDDFLIISASIEVPKDLPAKAKWEAA